MIRNDRLHSPLVVVLGLSGLLVGLVLFLTRGDVSKPVSAGADGRLLAEFQELRWAQVQTAEALTRIQELLAQRLDMPAPGSGDRRTIGALPSPESFDALARSLDALRLTFERESSESRA